MECWSNGVLNLEQLKVSSDFDFHITAVLHDSITPIFIFWSLMPFEFKFPDIGEGFDRREIVRWRVKEGETIKEGDPLVEVETDKALAEIPSPQTGVVLKILGREKEIIKVGQVIVVIGEKGEGAAAPAPPSRPKSVGVVDNWRKPPEEPVAAEAKPVVEKPALISEHALATPAVRGLAKELGVDINQVVGTGPGTGC